jgi:hypothetical protein
MEAKMTSDSQDDTKEQTQTAADHLKSEPTRPVDAADLLAIYDAMARISNGSKPTVDRLSNNELVLAHIIDQQFHLMEKTLELKCSDNPNLLEVPRPYLALARAVAFSLGILSAEIDKQRRFWKTIVLLVIIVLLILKGILV